MPTKTKKKPKKSKKPKPNWKDELLHQIIRKDTALGISGMNDKEFETLASKSVHTLLTKLYQLEVENVQLKNKESSHILTIKGLRRNLRISFVTLKALQEYAVHELH